MRVCAICVKINALARRSGWLKRLRGSDPSKSRDVSKDIEKMWKEHIQKHRFTREPGPSVARHRVRALPKAFPSGGTEGVLYHKSCKLESIAQKMSSESEMWYEQESTSSGIICKAWLFCGLAALLIACIILITLRSFR